MPKKKVDPLIHCLSYFRDAPLESARTALIIAADAVQHRVQQASGAPAPKKVTKKVNREERTDEVSHENQ